MIVMMILLSYLKKFLYPPFIPSCTCGFTPQYWRLKRLNLRGKTASANPSPPPTHSLAWSVVLRSIKGGGEGTSNGGGTGSR